MDDSGYSLTLTASSPVIAGTAFFPASHAAFDGHFPGRPILPAFMQIQVALDLLALAGLPSQLTGIENAKFLRPVLPGELISIELSPAGPLTFGGTLAVAGDPASHFTLLVESAAMTQESGTSRVDLR